VAKFSKKSVEIKVASGQGYPTITLNVRVFQAHKQEFLAARQLNAEGSISNLPTGVTVSSHALPLGLPNEDVIFLKRKCSEHIKFMVSEESDWILGNVEMNGGFDLPWRAFNSIRSYRRKSTHKNEAVSL
jgi:hypothetical protein